MLRMVVPKNGHPSIWQPGKWLLLVVVAVAVAVGIGVVVCTRLTRFLPFSSVSSCH